VSCPALQGLRYPLKSLSHSSQRIASLCSLRPEVPQQERLLCASGLVRLRPTTVSHWRVMRERILLDIVRVCNGLAVEKRMVG
jgi:hypothetical protein